MALCKSNILAQISYDTKGRDGQNIPAMVSPWAINIQARNWKKNPILLGLINRNNFFWKFLDFGFLVLSK